MSLNDSPPRNSSELDFLMARVAVGDRSVFGTLYEALAPAVRRLCLALLQNDADADDATQQALSKIYEQAHDYDTGRPALPWALAIASWECRSMLRRKGRRREVSDDGHATRSPDLVERDPEHRNLVRAAVQALQTLSPTDHETILATFWGESASVTGATLRKRRERALHRLRAAFKRMYGLDYD